MTTPAYLDVHAIQTLPYSNVNRDDLGAPKSVMFGGVERTRVSSQSWKRAVRLHVEKVVGEDTVRTRRVVRGVAERLTSSAWGWSRVDAEAAGLQVALSAGSGISLKAEKNERGEQVQTTSVLLLLPEAGIDDLAALADKHRQEILAEEARPKKGKTDKIKPVLPSKDIAEILGRRSGTINLFGRMLVELPGANVDGAVQFAHAFTTHGTSVEYDFFSAVDDVEDRLGIPGSGHINTAYFSAGTFYRYANVGLARLDANLDGDVAVTRTLVDAFLDGFVNAVPSGKQNSTGAVTPPDLVYVTVRSDRPVSLSSAFETPLGGKNGYLAGSVERLASHAASMTTLLTSENVLFAGHAAADLTVEGHPAERLAAFGTRHESFRALITAAVQAACVERQA
ncbi:CRISPR system Cascade subunit CasC [Actinoalloteichus hoggarensis]|uniref:CRISPR system Cascade subunit CasC n=1 Tax=Actinoalloteichus hoggarensis TaxID=1470176 RepID=A0A221W530_9PSEU|nr:type I-E CRISPR-associated protein Cas7/Cse4/CasC [Actinoalloteichus hoggarensis]ASO20766.1 CRISPR system Cascade subunit CasC [Actinoalloteichus hoggarensis]MBB5920696.1 CRISPR system Cascade subunit CasC [Actinoalloteichus hoggarensis]